MTKLVLAALSLVALSLVLAPRARAGRAPIEDVLPPRFSFGVSTFSAIGTWPEDVKASYGIDWDYMYSYVITPDWQDWWLENKLDRADAIGAIPVLTFYGLLNLGQQEGYTGVESAIVYQTLQTPSLVATYFNDAKRALQICATFGKPVIFQSEPDSWAFMEYNYTAGTFNATNCPAAVASSGHPDAASFADNLAGFAQALIHLRDVYAPDNVYMGLCAFDFNGGWHPADTVSFVNSLGARWDILFKRGAVRYATKGDGWWLTYSETDTRRRLSFALTLSRATGLKFLTWQLPVGAMDWGIMEDYPTQERVSKLIGAGLVGAMFDMYTLAGPPHHQPAHGYTDIPPSDPDISADALAERLSRYYQSPMGLDQPPADSDGDGMPDCWETGHMLDPDDPADASLDRDNDGLTNLQEYELSTHPGRADSDYDGIDDLEDPFPLNEDYADWGGTGAEGSSGAGCAARESATSQPWEYTLLALLVLVLMKQSARRRGSLLRGPMSV